MDIKSVEFSVAFLDSLVGLSEREAKSVMDSVSFKVSEGPIDPTAPLADNNGVVGRMVVGLENGSTAVFALKRDSD